MNTASQFQQQSSGGSRLDPGIFAALAIGFAALLVWSLFQMRVLWVEREGLQQAATNQHKQFEAAEKVRKQLDSIATGMQKLADGGNGSAKLVVEELRKRGVTISRGSPATTAPGAAVPSAK